MKKNVGQLDRILRLVFAGVLAGIGYFTNQGWLYLIAIVPLATAMLNFCPLYTLLGINTCKIKHAAKK